MDWEVHFYLNAEGLPPGQGGVYLLFVGEILDYVGQSDDARHRLMGEHHVYEKEVHTLIAFIVERDYGARLSLERYFNNKYNPPNSFVGTEKQSIESSEWRMLSTEKRRKSWQGMKFADFPIDMAFAKNGTVVEFSQTQVTNNAMGVLSIVALKRKDVRKG